MKQKSKSQKRINLISLINEAITHDDIFRTIDYKKQTEDKIKQFIFPHLVDTLAESLVDRRGMTKEVAKGYVKKCLKWEGNVNTVVNHILFMGTQNRPDMILDMDGLKIAIEFKVGDKGSDLRCGIGQSMIYSTHYDFVVCLMIDTTEDKRILNSRGGVNETNFVDLLWNKFNIKFTVI